MGPDGEILDLALSEAESLLGHDVYLYGRVYVCLSVLLSTFPFPEKRYRIRRKIPDPLLGPN
jgi:hypothetical protein